MKPAPTGRLRFLFNNSVLYAGSNLLQRGVTFLLLPLYARYLSKGEFGAMEQVTQMVLILLIVSSLGLPQGLVRGIHLEARSRSERESLIGALTAFLVPVTALSAFALYALRAPLADLLFRGEGDSGWIALGVAFYLALALYQLPLELFKVQQEATSYVIWSLATFIALVSGNVYLVAHRGLGLRGMLLAGAAAYGGIGAILWARSLRRIGWNLEFRRLAPLFAYGLPMLPALACRKVLEVADRYMIPYYHGLEELGVYVMGAKIAAIVDAALLVPFLYAWQPFFYSLSDDHEAPRIFGRVTHYMSLLLAFLFLAVEAARVPLLDFLGNGQFARSASVITILMLSIVCNGLQYCISPGIHLRRRLVSEMGIMVAAAALNIVLNVLLIPPYRGLGAAVATCAAYLFYLAGTFLLSQSLYPVPYPWSRLGNTAAQTALAFVVMTRSESLAWRGAVLAIYVLACPLADLWRHGELASLLRRRSRAG